MKKRLGFISLLLILLVSCNSKTTDKTTSANNDSIQKYLALAGNDTLPFDKRIRYNDKALSFIDLEKNDSLTREYMNLVVANYLLKKDPSAYKKYSALYFKKASETGDSLSLARYYKHNGYYYSNKNIFDSAFCNFLKSEKIYKKIKNEDGLANFYSVMSNVQFKLDDNLGSELSAEKAYKYSKKVDNIKNQFFSLINIGNANHNLNQYEKAISAFKIALSLAKRKNLKKKKYSYIGTCLNNIGNTYRVQKKYKTAIYYFKLGLQEKNIAYRDPEIYAYLLNNLGYCYLKTNYNNKLSLLFEQSKKIFDSLGIKNESAICDVYLSEFYIKQDDTLKANLHAESALRLAKEANAPYYYLTALSNAGSINPKKAPIYIKNYHRINDSILFIERNARNQYYKIQLETDEIIEEKNTAIKQRSIYITLALTIFLVAILIFIIARQRLKQKELRLQQTKQKANEDIYELLLNQKSNEEKARYVEKKRIAMELHDGVMNRLTSTRLNLSELSNKRDEGTIKKCLSYIKDIYLIEKEIRNITHDLNREEFNASNSFVKLLEDYIAEQNQISHTHFSIAIDPMIDWNTISNITKMNLYRIIQEAIHNINKHAKAKTGTLNLLIDDKNICLSIIDDGIGFDLSEMEKGIGIKNIDHRVKTLDGKLNIHSKLDSGTSINIALPLQDLN